jgi:hypothetical protein
MAVTTFHDFPLAPRDREWDGAAAEKRVRAWADAQDKPNGRYRDAHLWYDAGGKQNFTAYKLLFTDVVNGRQVAVPRAIMAAGNIMQGSRGHRPPAIRHHPGQEPPREVLQENGRGSPLGARLMTPSLPP